MECPSLEVLKSCVDVVLSDVAWWSLGSAEFKIGLGILKIFSNLNNFVIL